MNCPFCNAKMKDGQVFCEKCGNEIHLVPLFEPEVEETMRSSIYGMMEGLEEEEQKKDSGEKTTEYDENKTEYIEHQPKQNVLQKKHRIYLFIAVTVGMIVLAVLILWGVSLLSKPADFASYLQKAKDAYSLEKYDSAVEFVEQAFSKGTTEDSLMEDAYLLLARSYISMSEVDAAEECLKEGIGKLKQNASLYKLWLQLEQQVGDYQAMADILSEVTDESLLTEYTDFICNVPRFDREGGDYFEVVNLKLSNDGKGKIYYTINGADPNEESEEYISPIKLENGSFEIKAVFVNQYGVMSDVAIADYHIDIATPDEPEISLESGIYNEPQQIDVFLLDDSYSVYYTMDGSDPDLSSNKYEGAILLPFGKSHYKFVMYDEDGVASDIADRTYEFNLQGAAVGIEQARIMLIQQLIVNGSIADVEGHVPGTQEIHTYSCNTAFSEGGQNYYLFVESETDALGNSIRTGSLYGVNVMTGEIYRVKKSENGTYSVESFS